MPYPKKWPGEGGKETRRKRLRAAVIAYLGGRCVRCGFSDPRALQIDHIDGGGTKERRIRGTGAIAIRVMEGAPGYQLLCANCNWIKRDEEGELVKWRS